MLTEIVKRFGSPSCKSLKIPEILWMVVLDLRAFLELDQELWELLKTSKAALFCLKITCE